MTNRIKEIRKIENLSQENLAEKSGVARSVISGLESGRITTVTTDTLEKIAKALNKKVIDIFF